MKPGRLCSILLPSAHSGSRRNIGPWPRRTALAIGYSGLCCGTALIWLAVGAADLCICLFAVPFRGAGRAQQESSRDPRAAAASGRERPRVLRQIRIRRAMGAVLGNLKVEFFGLVKSTSFIVITCAALAEHDSQPHSQRVGGLWQHVVPGDVRLIEIIQGTLYIFLIGMLTYYAGTLVWKERDAGMDEIEDALPHRRLAVLRIQARRPAVHHFLIVCLARRERHLTQLFSGYHRYQFGLVGHRAAGDGFHHSSSSSRCWRTSFT
jgi:ABC-2 type transport system permease protein